MAYPEKPLKLPIIREKNPVLPLGAEEEPARELIEPPDLPYQ
jgi:hypothetical protein